MHAPFFLTTHYFCVTFLIFIYRLINFVITNKKKKKDQETVVFKKKSLKNYLRVPYIYLS